jgi:hypothetical protein
MCQVIRASPRVSRQPLVEQPLDVVDGPALGPRLLAVPPVVAERDLVVELPELVGKRQDHREERIEPVDDGLVQRLGCSSR